MEEQFNTQEEQILFQQLQNQKGFKIKPCEKHVNFSNHEQFRELNLTVDQKLQISELLQHIPAMTAAGAMANAYTVNFPQGLPHTLMALKQGGFGSSIISDGKIVGAASFYPMLGQAAILGIFTAMSIATGQFFLARINKELQKINQKLDEIMKFLYGDKKAELLSEVSFIKYACDNYVSIMEHESQRTATIVSIQEARKVAMKDIEFYMNDLEQKIESGKKQNFKFLDSLIDHEVKQAEENLDLSLQLYFISNVMEVYYAQNFEENYICNLEKDIKFYIKICNNQIHSLYGRLQGYLADCRSSGKIETKLEDKKKELNISLEEKCENYDMICEHLYAILHTSAKEAEYYLQVDEDTCNVYYKAS